ncbi:MAG: 3'-5' exonuclease, partial [Armatimonadota bacterium]
ASRAENLREFLTVTKRFQESREDASLGAFIEHICLLSDVDELEDQGNAVALMTLHAAKGLEFPIVFIAGLEEGLLPHQRSLVDGGLDEERRLCYVGITRAQERLFLTHGFRRTIFGRTETTVASRFLKELPAEFVDRRDEITRLKAARPRDDEAAVDGKRAGGPKLNLVKILNRGSAERGGEASAARRGPEGRGPRRPATKAFNAGDKVKHAKFGKGIVVSCDESEGKTVVTVAFPSAGVKRLALEYAGLEKA